MKDKFIYVIMTIIFLGIGIFVSFGFDSIKAKIYAKAINTEITK